MNATMTSRLFALFAASMLALGNGCDAEAPCDDDESCGAEEAVGEGCHGEDCDQDSEEGASEEGASEDQASEEGASEDRASEELDTMPGVGKLNGDDVAGAVPRGIVWDPTQGCANLGRVWNPSTGRCFSPEQSACILKGYYWASSVQKCFPTATAFHQDECARQGMTYWGGHCSSIPH